jgi:AraC-like DNA-binding protein
MLRRPKLPLAEIATDCEFTGPDHFARVFTTLFGIDPAIWRSRLESWTALVCRMKNSRINLQTDDRFVKERADERCF